MRRALLQGVLIATLAWPAGAQPVNDHLQCYQINDPLKLRGTVDLTTRLGLETGCRIKRARLACTPAQSTVAAGGPAAPIDGRGLLDARICYRVRCRRPNPPGQIVTDEFGTRTLAHPKVKLLCTPAVLGPPLPLRDSLDHLKCYKVVDPAPPRATVNTNAAPGGAINGCSLSRTRLLCTSAATSNLSVNVSPLLDLGAGSAADDDRVCYRLKCPAATAPQQVVSDRFGSRTLTKLVPKLLCSPAPAATLPTTTTTSTTVTTTTLPAGTEQALVCQRTIESGGMAYADKLMDEIQGCAAPGQSQPLDTCVGSAAVQSRLGTVESDWEAHMTTACAGVDLRHDLGYLETCPAPCTNPSTTIAGVRTCLACRLRSTLTDAARSAYANQPVGSSSCRDALGDGSLGALRTTLQQLDTCAQQPGATSVAACFAPALAAWRSQAESTCAGVDPFGTLGYSRSCSGTPPVFPGFCASEAKPCSFPEASGLSGPGQSDDLLDCLECQTEEAVLAVARDLHGANLCCAGGVCNRVLTRFACREAGGVPVRYRIDSLATDPVFGPHGIGWGLDGAFYIADSGQGRVLKVSGTTVTVVGTTPPFPTGVAADVAGNVYVTNRCDHTITKFAVGGGSSIFAGTSGTPGSSGDEGPAAAALITAPDGITVDPAGNVYFTESRALSFVCAAQGPATERVRVIDAAGTIHAFAGNTGYGMGGEGGPQLAAQLGLPYGLRWSGGSLLVGEAGVERVMRVTGGTMTRVAGRPSSPVAAHSGYGGPAVKARFYENCGVGQDADGNVIIGPMEDNRIALVDSLGSVIAIAGTGEGAFGSAGDGGLALLGQAGCPEDLDVGPDGRVYFSDLQTSRIRVLTREQF